MNCEWCTTRQATHMGKPHVGGDSRMCWPCVLRVCRRDEHGKPVAMTMEEYAKLNKEEH